MFEGLVYSQVSEEFVKPLFPADGENMEVSILFSPELSVDACYCASNHNGVNWRTGASRHEKGRYYFSLQAAYKPESLRYYFIFRTGGRFYYYSKRGVSIFPPEAKNHFTITPSLESPKWIASSYCYQIFPDRFCNGDPSNDVRDGEYFYNGTYVTSHSFDEKPANYEKARCVDFYNGDLKGVEDKLDYLASLGVSCIYLNPIGRSYTVHRFDAIDYFHVDEKLGGDEALVSLIGKAHEKGIRVVVDISINHTSTENEWFKKAAADPESEEAGYYYIDKDGRFATWAGIDTMPQLNFNSQKLRDRLYRKEDSVMQKFLRKPFNQDGWRLDVAPELGRNKTDQLCKEVWREVHQYLKAVNKDIYLVGEDWNDASEYLEGDMWDATMNYYGSGRPLRSWLGERDRYLTEAWGHSPEVDVPYNAYELAAALQTSMDAGYDLSRYFRMNLYDSHDTPRLHNHLAIYNQKRYEGVVMAFCLLPGMPNIYYGDEVGLDGEMGSVEGSRYPMWWDEKKWNKDTLSVHRLMGEIRKDKDLAFASVYFIPLDYDALAILRRTENKAWLLVLNKGKARDVKLSSFLLDGYKVESSPYNDAHCGIDWTFSLEENTSQFFVLGK